MEHQDELRLEAVEKASRVRRIEAEVLQHQVISHVMKPHQSHYTLLEVQSHYVHDLAACTRRYHSAETSGYCRSQIQPVQLTSAEHGEDCRRLYIQIDVNILELRKHLSR